MNDPFKIDSPTCISFSGGRTSAYMLWRVLQSNGGKLPKDTAVLFANTGKEDYLTLKFVNDCSRHWNVNIHWVEFNDGSLGFREVFYQQSASEYGQPFAVLIKKKNYLPNAVARFCTSDLKIKPISAWLKHHGFGETEMMVGIRADEPRRIAKMPHLHKPLAIAGITKQDVFTFWGKQPFDLLADESNCDLCFLKGFHQVNSAIRKKPEKAIWWAHQEKTINATFCKDRPSYEQMRLNAVNQADMHGYEDEAISCFCGD